MGFDKREAGKPYARQEGDTLEAIAERETAAGNEITWEELARFNWGTTDREQVNELLRDELGCRKRDADNNFIIAADDSGTGQLVIPQPFVKSGLATDKQHTLRVKQKSCPEQFIECCKIPGVTFEFDKSFIRPTVVDHLKALDAMAAANPDAKILVFGHTDKVGGPQYNKGLSERRAKSAYAFVVNDNDPKDPNIWESLYNEENWGLKVVQQILKDLGHDPGPIDGVMGPQTQAAMKSFDPSATSNNAAFRKKLFTAYMTTIHDVKIEPDRFMEPKHMGCGEFNPIDDVEHEHEPNRRVTFYLFHKDRLPKLPCEFTNLAPCEKQRSPRLPRHKESFSCSFYDSIAKKCSCEGPPPGPTPATMEIIDAKGNVATAVKMGLWDNAFDASGNVLNNVAEADNFCGDDSRRFHFRVTDPGATGSSVNIDWKTLLSSKANLDSAGSPLTLVETPAGSKTFVSKGVMLCCDLNDVKQVTNSGLTAPASETGDRSHTQSNHRTRTGDLEGFVKGEYTPASGAPAVSVELPVFDRSPDERRRLPLQVFVLRVAAGGAGVVPTAAGSALRTTDLRVIKESYERIGLKVETVVAPGTPPADVVTVDGLSIVLINAPAGINPLNVTLANEATIGGAFPAVGHTVRVFVTGGLARGVRGEAAPDVDFAGAPDQGTAFINGPTKGPYTTAHEIGHMLTNKSSTVNRGHYNAPAAPAGNRFFNNQNLMRNGTSTAEGVNQSKRLWDASDGDGVNAFDVSRGSPYTRAF